MKSRIVAGAFLLILVPLAGAAGASERTHHNAPPGLTQRGAVLWNLEGLLRRTYDSRDICVVRSQQSSVSFRGGRFACTPIAAYAPYLYVFRAHRATAFHVTSRRGHPVFGNYPVPVRMRGRLVACDRFEHRFVIEYSDAAGYTFDCLSAAGPG